MPGTPESELSLAVNGGHLTPTSHAGPAVSGGEKTILSSAALEIMARDPNVQSELTRLTSTNVFDVCQAFNLSNATLDEISFVMVIPKFGIEEAIRIASSFGWDYRRVADCIVAHFRHAFRMAQPQQGSNE